ASFMPDGKSIVTDLRQYNLLSGEHRLYIDDPTRRGITYSVELDSTDTYGYVFAPDGKTFRTIAHRRGSKQSPATILVQEVEMESGKVQKTLLKVVVDPRANTLFPTNYLSNDGKRFIMRETAQDGDGKTTGRLTIYDVDRGVKIFSEPLRVPNSTSYDAI